jgi:hypothetical protein
VGISEIEFLGSGSSDDDAGRGTAPAADRSADPDADAEFDAVPGFGAGRQHAARDWLRRLRQIRQYRVQQLPGGRVTASLAALLIAVAAGAFAVVRQSESTADAFDISLLSAVYTLPQDASGIDLSLTLRNSGATMVELTGVALAQPGLIRLAQNTAGTESAASVAPAAVRNAITPIAVPPQGIEVLTVPFRYDCTSSATPPVTRTVSLAGLSAHGQTRTGLLMLPSNASPWGPGNLMRSAVCEQPAPQTDLTVQYGGLGRTLMEVTPVSATYTITLTAPTATSVTVNRISQDNPGITASMDPQLPAEVLDGQTVSLTVSWRVVNCAIATSVHSGDGVEITATANQAVETWHASLGAQFSADLDAGINTVCSGR